jgi:hypothetical protein
MTIIVILHLLEPDLTVTGSFAHLLLYADPGSGALALQLLLASFFGALFYLRSYLVRLKRILTGRARRVAVRGMSECKTPPATAESSETVHPKRER